jgi:hypothetical protein
MLRKWKTYLPIAVGLTILMVPTVYILNESNSIFAEQCRQQCAVIGMDFRVKAVGMQRGGDLQYPGQCECVVRGLKKWWEFWK